ncbi:prominin-2 [Etheostoma spectabile]|uniref:prominin-2 n=1 Tax=Etheostoma spectabile TaxID=54343 RepID=UPI0013AE9F1D|nr:prominin-1-A-like [Etheostoma spectabile]XP_032397075.1 prominin-1-A-like [Etheostoma spectabile]XP_032397076.1 prominin-1-A-like [Etheostoma spectabile]
MGLCESVRGRCWPGSAGTFRAGVGVLLLGLSLAQTVPPQPACPAAVAPQSLVQPQYQDTAAVDNGVGFMAALVQSFLQTVQPNPLPNDLILKIVHDFDQKTLDQEIIKKILVYEVGFLVCAAIGVLYIVLMPIVGFFLACCRCCGNCGGKMYQKQTSSIHCLRRTLYWTAFVTTAIILAGNICMFKSNKAVKVSVDQSQMELNQTIGNIQSFLAAVPQQVNNVVNESYRTVQEVTRNLDAIGPLLGTEIKERFRGTLDPALHSVKLLDQETVNISLYVDKLNSSLAQLQSSMDRIQANFTAVKNQINQTLSKPNCNGCNILQSELQKIPLDISITIPTFNDFKSAVDEVNKINLKSQIKKVEDYFDSIPQRVTNDTKDVVQSSKQLLGGIKTQISEVTNDIPLSNLTKVSETLNQVQGEIGMVTPAVERAEYIRWAVCVVLCCMVLLVVLCNLLGLVLGPLGLKPKAQPTKRSCTSDCGGVFLLMGAGFSFLFSWLFMIVVLVLFLLGGNVYTLLCRPWSNGELFKLIDTPGLIPGLEIGPTLGLKTNISISEIYRDCKDNQPLWTTLHLYELIDLGDLLNVSKYTEQIQQLFENENINLATITLLSPEVKKQLGIFSNRATNIDSTAVTQKMNNISSINLNTTADKIDDIAVIQSNNDIKKELQNEARDLRQIQTNIETTIIPQLKNLNSTLQSLGSITEKINGTVGEVLSNVGAAQDFFNTSSAQIVRTESKKFLDCQLNYFLVYADWVNITITQQVGRCGPVAGAVDSVEIILCSHIVESLNAFWFSLGWCMIFFIPSIIFSIKLAKYYRRMKYSDAYDDHLIMNHIPRAQTKFT